MKITNELLAAYAEGNVTPEERKVVRRYLVDHLSELESVMFMMDSDDDMDVTPQKEISFKGAAASPQTFGLAFSSRAFFAPKRAVESYCCASESSSDAFSPKTFDDRLNDLLDEIF